MSAMDTVLAKYTWNERMRILDAISAVEKGQFESLQDALEFVCIYMTSSDKAVCEVEILDGHWKI